MCPIATPKILKIFRIRLPSSYNSSILLMFLIHPAVSQLSSSNALPRYLDIIVKFSTKSSVFLNRAHIIQTSLPSFNLALSKVRDNSFKNIVVHQRCIFKNFAKFSERLFLNNYEPITITQLSTVMKSKEDNIAGFFSNCGQLTNVCQHS